MWQAIYEKAIGRKKDKDEWYNLQRYEDIIIGGVYGSADGLVRVKEASTKPDEIFGEVIYSTNPDIHKGDVFSYRFDELYRGADNKWKNWNTEALRDYILGQARHKNVDDINTNPVMENDIYEASLDDEEVSDLIKKALSSAKKIAGDKDRKKSEIKKAQDVVKWVSGVQRTWRKEKSLHPNAVNGLMRVVAGTSSKNPDGFGYRTFGWSSSPDGEVPQDYRNRSEGGADPLSSVLRSTEDCEATPKGRLQGNRELLHEGRGRKLSDAIIKSSALMVKRWVIQKGKEENISAQMNGIASLILLNMALSDRGESIMSKALAVSGFFREENKYEKI